jgi:spore coat polysaccharide biosynthesis protein SpsF
MAINAEALALNADYSGYSGLPYGAGVESVCAAALLRAESETASPYDREHVCPYLYTHPDFFSLHRPIAPLRWQGKDIRLTVDTREDFDRALVLYDALKDEPLRYHGAVIIKKYAEIFKK